MTNPPWWATISTDKLLELRRECLAHLQIQFGSKLAAEREDLAQHALAVLLQRSEPVEGGSKGLRRYVLAVAHRAAVDRIRSASSRQAGAHRGSTEADMPPGEPDTPSTPSDEENERIWQIYCALDDLDRLILWSYVVQDNSIRAIARELDLNWHRVAQTIERVLGRFRRELGQE